MRRVVITGLGCVTSIGRSAPEFWKALLNSQSGIRDGIRPPEFKSSKSERDLWKKLKPRLGAYNFAAWIPDLCKEQRVHNFAQIAANEAIKDANLKNLSGTERENVGINIGTGIGCLNDIENYILNFHQYGYSKLSPRFISNILSNTSTGRLMIENDFRGPNHTACTACATGAHSIGDGFRFIRDGDAKIMISGSAEACISPLTVAGFAKARTLAKRSNPQEDLKSLSRPFDDNRKGFVLGEGSGVIIMEELEHALERNAHIYCEMIGYGLSSDSFHLMTPSKEGLGAFLAMKRSLQFGGVTPHQIDYINAHATGTVVGDRAEMAAISRCLSEDLNSNRDHLTYVSSIKGALGHLLGAAGAVEAIAAIKAIKENLIPPTLNLESTTDLDLNAQLRFVTESNFRSKVNFALTNSFGFGGTNASLLFARFEG